MYNELRTVITSTTYIIVISDFLENHSTKMFTFVTVP